MLLTKSAKDCAAALGRKRGERAVLYHGDCRELLRELPDASVDLVVTSPPYCIGKEYERNATIGDFTRAHESVLPDVVRVVKPGGSICWQVGYYVKNGVVTPLDFLVHGLLQGFKDLRLRNRIVWSFGHGLHASSRFSGRYEVILWYTKGADYKFNLDAVRVPQKYPGKRSSRGPKKGQPSGNPLGKNPGDVWEIPNVRSNHVEKTGHPCQFPVGLVQRLVRALTDPSGVVLDPFAGSASAGVASLADGRRFVGAEVSARYIKIAKKRLEAAANNTAKFRPVEREIYVPRPHTKVGRVPDEWLRSGKKARKK